MQSRKLNLLILVLQKYRKILLSRSILRKHMLVRLNELEMIDSDAETE